MTGAQARTVDVLIVGAGLSGVDMAYRVKTECPDRSFAVLESRERSGGTWDLFTYPGVRTDSDMYTLAYPFQPWRGEKSMVAGPDILQYIRDTASQHGLDRHVYYQHRVASAAWSSDEARWRVEVDTPEGQVSYVCQFLVLASGYYDYEHPYEAQIPGLADFAGQVVHPQFWPEDLDYKNRRVVIVGSGATAVTLLPALAQQAGHVTQLQRSPTYVMSRPSVDALADLARKYLPAQQAHTFIRWKNTLLTMALYGYSRRFPQRTRELLTQAVRDQLPASVDVDVHFNPRYDPWDQRLCLAPDGDYFEAIRAGGASVVTDRIARVGEHSILLESGAELPADVIVTATGLELQFLGGASLQVDGEEVNLPEHLIYRGMMMSGVPNAAMIMGYFNASWTLRADLSARYFTRLMNHMQRRGLRSATPTPPADVRPMPLMEYSSGYLQRGLPRMPKQGEEPPWLTRQNAVRDWLSIRFADLTRDMTFR